MNCHSAKYYLKTVNENIYTYHFYYGLEYKYVTLYVTGQIDYATMFNSLETAIHQFAKRQMTWFRGMERRGIPIHWLSNVPTTLDEWPDYLRKNKLEQLIP